MFALLDMDSFYAQVESKRLGFSNEVPLGVKQHEHFIAVNYAARRRGVPSRCAVDRAKQICPEVVVAEVEMIHDVKPSLERYRRASEQVLNVLLEFFDEEHIEKASIDEAYVNLMPLCLKAAADNRVVLKDHEKVLCATDDISDESPEERTLLVTASNIMYQVRQAIENKLQFTSSCGIAHNKLLAKIAASKNKPAGQTIVFKSGAKGMMRTTGLRKIKGLGGKLGKRLENILKQVPQPVNDDDNVLGAIQDGLITFAMLEKELGTKTARYVVSRANGEDESEVVSKVKPKTLLSMKTFYHSLTFNQVQDWIRLESDELAKRLILDHELFKRLPRTLVLHFHRNDGEHISRRTAFHANHLLSPNALAEDIFRAGDALMRQVDGNKEGSRGVGMGLENFTESIAQNAAAGTTVPRITEFFGVAKPANVNKNDEVSVINASEEDVDEEIGSDEDHFGFAMEDSDDDLPDSDGRNIANENESENEPGEEDEYSETLAEAGPVAQGLSPAAKLSLALRRPQTSSETGATAFVARFFKASRLSFIGSWKRRFEELLDTIPPPPPLGNARFGERVIVHVDMDAFFCTASLLKRPDLIEMPVAVCWSNATSEASTTSSAEISSCNYVARKRGVKASMSLARAKLLCPELTCIPFDFDLYESTGMTFYRALFDLTPHVEGVSCDEAYLDVTHLVDDKTKVRDIMERLRTTIFERTGGVTASAGAGKNRLIARLSTAKAKPNGSVSFSFSEDADIIAKLLNEDVDVRDLPSIGWSTCDKLKRELDVSTVKDLRAVPLSRLKYFFGPKIGEKMYNLCRGIDTRFWNPRPVRDSVSVQISWGVRMQNLKEVHDFLGELAKECYRRLGTRQGDAVNLKIWRAVEDQPEHHRKGQVGHGVCDILTRHKPQMIRGLKDTVSVATENPLVSSSSSSSNAVKGLGPSTDEKQLLATAIELFTELRVLPEDVRGLGLFITGLAGAKNNTGASASGAIKRRKVAVNIASPSRWIDGVGVVTAKRYKGETKASSLNTVTSEKDRWEGFLKNIVGAGDAACRETVEKELKYAFEEVRCDLWPTCKAGEVCDCFNNHSLAVLECANLVASLIQQGADHSLASFARIKAGLLYGILPRMHPLTRFKETGGGVLLLEEALEDLCGGRRSASNSDNM